MTCAGQGLKDWLVHESSDRHTYYQALFKYESAEPDDLNLEVDEIVLGKIASLLRCCPLLWHK